MDLVWGVYGLPVPEKEYRFAPGRRWRFDYAWPDRRIAVEIEGGIWQMGRHNRPRGFLKDMEKYNAAAQLSWQIYRFTPQELRKGQAQAFMKKVFNVK